MNNGHFAGKIKQFVDDAVSKAKGTEGQLYKIMNSHGFYDVADENNGLTDWQRAQVPSYNQHRISDLCDAIADMFGDMLSNDEYGILYPNMDDVVGKLDLNATKNASELNVIGGALGGLTGGASESARQAMGQLTAILMGGFAFDPNILPPITFNIPGLPINIANAFKNGSYPADWTFLYDHETVKSSQFYEADDGGIAIGAGIKLNMGPARQQILKLIFSVPDVDENGMAKGDAYGGITPEEFNSMYKISDKTFSELDDDDKEFVKTFKLDSTQMQLSYFRMIQLTLWGAIKNPDNWAFLHWGCLTHNSCPGPVKTAICSFIHTNGFAVDPQISPESGFISYCVNTGMAYTTGRSKPTALLLIPGMIYLNDKKEKVTVKEGDQIAWSSANNGVPVNKDLAKKHFTLAADILAHLTYDTNPNARELRKRRIDEANLIYEYVGLQRMKFGDTFIPPDLAGQALQQRNFSQLVKAEIKVYENKNSTLPLSDANFKIVNQAERGSNELSNTTISTIKYILAKAGLPGIVVTSVYRSPEAQSRAMFNNRQSHNGAIAVNYAAKGRAVDDIYTQASKKANNGACVAIKDPLLQQKVKKDMQDKCQEFMEAGTPVSNHGHDPSKIQAVDMGPNSSKAYFRYNDAQMRKFNTACWDAYQEGYLKQYLGPSEYGGPKVKDPAFHIEVWQDDNHKHPDTFSDANVLPTVNCKVLDENLKNKNTWDLVFVHDQTLA